MYSEQVNSRYSIKVYSKDLVFKFPISSNDLKSKIQFTSQINWWQGQFNLTLNESFLYLWISVWDVIKVKFDKQVIYSWVVWNINRSVNENFQSISFPVLWLWSLFSKVPYRESWSTFSKTQDVAETVRDIVDYMNTKYSWYFSYDWSSIPIWLASKTIKFEKVTCMEALKICADRMKMRFYIDKNWKVFFKSKWVASEYKMNYWDSVQNIEVKEDWEKIVNSIVIFYDSWSLVKQNLSSISTYWLKEIIYSNSSLDATAADEYWQNYVDLYWTPLKSTNITVNRNFLKENWDQIESIEIWDIITVENFENYILNLQIVKYEYIYDRKIIDLESFTSFWKEVFTS